MKPTNCMDCAFHKVIADPDPHDWFCDDDKAVVCTKTLREDKVEPDSKYMAERQEFKPITVGCRPYSLRRESNTPEWCPIT